MTGRHGNNREPFLEDSSLVDIDNSYNQEEAIVSGPLVPQQQMNPYREESVNHSPKTNLNKFLEKRKERGNQTANVPRRNRIEEEDDALAR